jgi:uncharacterized membrane protein (DUF4010 family)
MQIDLQSLMTAVAIGLLIGVIRERHHPGDGVAVSGIRTHTLVAICAAIAVGFGMAVFIVLLLAVAALAMAGYLHTRATDPGLTGEVSLLTTALLAGLAQHDAVLAAGLAVVVAVLLFAKRPLQRFARKVVSEGEVEDGLLLAAAALIVLPLLPDAAVDPWGVLVPSALWKLVVLVMAVGMLGHVALRLVGARWGLPMAGFFAGFASSTAAVAGFGQHSREDASLSAPSASAALLSNLASLLLLAGIAGTAAPSLLRASVWPLTAAALVLVLAALYGLRHKGTTPALPREPVARAFRLGHALLLVVVIAGVLLLSAWLRSLFGDGGAVVTAMVVALAELHAAAASIAQMARSGGLSLEHARLGLAGLLAASALAKTVLAFVSGNRRYAVHVGAGLIGMAAAGLLVTVLLPSSGVGAT